MATVTTYVNFKGGVGKTTSAVSHAVELAERGHPTLLIGFNEDPGLANWFMPMEERARLLPDQTSYRMFSAWKDLHHGLERIIDLNPDAVNPTTGKRRYRAPRQIEDFGARWGWNRTPAPLTYIPDSEALFGMELALARTESASGFTVDANDRISLAMRELLARPDLQIVIDMAPARSEFILHNVLRITDRVVIPSDFSSLSLEAMRTFHQIVMANENMRRKRIGLPEIRLLGVLLCRYDPTVLDDDDQPLHDKIVGIYRRELGDLLFSTLIPRDGACEAATFRHVPIQLYKPTAPVSAAYAQLAQEVMRRG